MDNTTARTAQVPPTTSRGSSPNRATPTAAMTHTAGSCTSAQSPSNRIRPPPGITGAGGWSEAHATRPGLSGADFDLLEMLGTHVATALVATRVSIPPA